MDSDENLVSICVGSTQNGVLVPNIVLVPNYVHNLLSRASGKIGMIVWVLSVIVPWSDFEGSCESISNLGFLFLCIVLQ